MLHTMHYSDEIRSSEEIHGATTSVNESELKLAERLISDLSKDKFEADKFQDSYRQKILQAAQQKAAGEKFTVPTPPKRAKVIDLMSALGDSLRRGKGEASKDSEDEDANPHADRPQHSKRARRAPRSSRRKLATAAHAHE